MNPALRYIAALPGLFFLLSGLRWIIDPAGAAGSLGMSMQEGLGLSTQIGDGGAFLLGAGVMTILGLIKKERIWLLAPALLLTIVPVYRILSTLIYGAPFAAVFIAVEVILAAMLLTAAKATENA